MNPKKRTNSQFDNHSMYCIDKKMGGMPLIADFVPVQRAPKSYHNGLAKLFGLLLALIVGLYFYPLSNMSAVSSETAQDNCIAKELKIMSKEITTLLQIELAKMNAKYSDAEKRIDERIKMALATHEADKLGMIDYALESGGGHIVSTPDTSTFPSKVTFSMFGIFAFHTYSNPRVILHASTMPGECYAFSGHRGHFRIKLALHINISAISLEHASVKTLVDIRSAPREFIVYGLDDEFSENGVELGQFVYDINSDPLQTFKLQVDTDNLTSSSDYKNRWKSHRYQYVELSILSNYGHPQYTCLYRFRVHGHH